MNEFQKYLSNTTPFVLDGRQIKNLFELVKALKEIDNKTFARFNNYENNDFYFWIKESVGDKRLARDIMKIRIKENFVDIIEKRIIELKDYARHPDKTLDEKKIDMYVDHVRFWFDNEMCSNCEICSLVCPKEAVEVKDGKKTVNDDCVLCGFCVNFCPLECIYLTYNEETKNDYIEKKMIPKLPEKEVINDVEARRLYSGTHYVKEKCPKDCELCVVACPINIIRRFDNNKQLDKIKIKKHHCLLCGACKNACPHDLIEIKRTSIFHDGDEYCNAWNTTIEKLTKEEGKSLYHNNKNIRKIMDLANKSGIVKKDG